MASNILLWDLKHAHVPLTHGRRIEVLPNGLPLLDPRTAEGFSFLELPLAGADQCDGMESAWSHRWVTCWRMPVTPGHAREPSPRPEN